MSYPIVEVPAEAPAQLEQLGTKAKFWYRAEDGCRTLFKEGYPGSGEHWAEKIACEVARALGLPHAEYELATWKGRPGVISPTLVPPGGRLIHGNELLARVEPDYDATRRRRCAQHTVARVLAVLRGPDVGTPMGWACPQGIVDACGVFVGYLALDALIGNQDRHHENWGLLRVPGVGLAIAPSFDHASSLGRNEADAVREERLRTRDAGRSLAAYVRRARSGLYKGHSSPKPLTTLDAYGEARLLHAAAARFWRSRIEGLAPAVLETIVERLPATVASEWAQRFALAIMLENRLRILALE